MSTFGDFDDDDAFDIEPADPEQVARKRDALARLRHPPHVIDELVTAWLRRQGSS